MLNILINRKHLLTASDIIIVAFEFIGINFRITILGCVLQTGKDLQFLWCNGSKRAQASTTLKFLSHSQFDSHTPKISLSERSPTQIIQRNTRYKQAQDSNPQPLRLSSCRPTHQAAVHHDRHDNVFTYYSDLIISPFIYKHIYFINLIFPQIMQYPVMVISIRFMCQFHT